MQRAVTIRRKASQLCHLDAVLHVGHVRSLIGKTRHVFRTHNDNNNHLISPVVASVYVCRYAAAFVGSAPRWLLSRLGTAAYFRVYRVPLLLSLQELNVSFVGLRTGAPNQGREGDAGAAAPSKVKLKKKKKRTKILVTR